MSTPHSALVDTNKLVEAQTSFSMVFENAYNSDNTLWWEQLATEIPAEGTTVKMPFLGQLGRLKKWVGERTYQSLSRYANTIEASPFEDSFSIGIDEINFDRYGSYDSKFKDLGYQAAQWPQDLLVDLIKANGVCWDGQNFFDTDHPIEGGGAFANSFTSKPLTDANLQLVLAAMSEIPGRDGRSLGFGKDLVLIVPKALEYTAKQIVRAATVASGGENIMAGIARVLPIPDLNIGTSASATTWYVGDVGHGVKPLLVAFPQKPILRQDESRVFSHREVLYGVDALGAAAYGMPHLMAKVTA